MDAIILAGGVGSRLLPLTMTTPKPLLKINNLPLIHHQINLLINHGVDNIVISVGYLGEKIIEYLSEHSYNCSITFAMENEPLGTGGGIKNCEKQIESRSFIVIYGDIYTNLNLNLLRKYHKQKKGIGSIVVHKSTHPKDSDIVKINDDDLVTEIYRPTKISENERYISKSSIYLLNKAVFKYMPYYKHSFEFDILPILIDKEKIYGYYTDELAYDIGTMKRYDYINNNK